MAAQAPKDVAAEQTDDSKKLSRLSSNFESDYRNADGGRMGEACPPAAAFPESSLTTFNAAGGGVPPSRRLCAERVRDERAASLESIRFHRSSCRYLLRAALVPTVLQRYSGARIRSKSSDIVLSTCRFGAVASASSTSACVHLRRRLVGCPADKAQEPSRANAAGDSAQFACDPPPTEYSSTHSQP